MTKFIKFFDKIVNIGPIVFMVIFTASIYICFAALLIFKNMYEIPQIELNEIADLVLSLNLVIFVSFDLLIIFRLLWLKYVKKDSTITWY